MSDSFSAGESGDTASGGPEPGSDTIVLRAVFVPDGQQPPAEFLEDSNRLTFRAELNPATGELTCEGAGGGISDDLAATWVSSADGNQGNDDPFHHEGSGFDQDAGDGMDF